MDKKNEDIEDNSTKNSDKKILNDNFKKIDKKDEDIEDNSTKNSGKKKLSDKIKKIEKCNCI